MKKQIKVPFKGKQQVSFFYEYEVEKGRVNLIDNFQFETTLRYLGFTRGRSALNIQWLDLKNNKTYESGMSLLDESLRGANQTTLNLVNGLGTLHIEGVFTWKKQGTAILLTDVKQEF